MVTKATFNLGDHIAHKQIPLLLREWTGGAKGTGTGKHTGERLGSVHAQRACARARVCRVHLWYHTAY